VAAKKPAARRLAERYQKEALRAVNRRGFFGAVELIKDVRQAVEYWRAHTPTSIRVEMPGLPGDWSLRMYWLVANDPQSGQAPQLVESAISLNVESPFTEPFSTRCLIRYDIDHRALTSPTHKYSPAHLNVLQPGSLEDHAHYPIVGQPLEEWPVDLVVEFLLSDELRADLAGRI